MIAGKQCEMAHSRGDYRQTIDQEHEPATSGGRLGALETVRFEGGDGAETDPGTQCVAEGESRWQLTSSAVAGNFVDKRAAAAAVQGMKSMVEVAGRLALGIESETATGTMVVDQGHH